MSEKIVGHKTKYDERGHIYHEPLTESEANALIGSIQKDDKRRKELMPDEKSAIQMLFDAAERLRELGWKNPVYCPKDGTIFKVLEIGSTGQHDCFYMGDWPKGNWWIVGDGDMCPSRPALFKLKEEN